MAPESLVTVMTIAVVISAIAMVAMAVMVFGMFKSLTALRTQMITVVPKVESLVSIASQTLADNRQQINDITSRAAHVLEGAQKNLARVDSLVEDATHRARVQMERLELVMGDTVDRVHHAVVAVNEAVVKPVREVNGMASGVKAAVRHLIRSNRPTPAQATTDEEMFI